MILENIKKNTENIKNDGQSVVPLNLNQEISFLSQSNIPNIHLTNISIVNRELVVTASKDNLVVSIKITFPSVYPNEASRLNFFSFILLIKFSFILIILIIKFSIILINF